MKIYDAGNDFFPYGGEIEKIICVYFVPKSGSNFLAEKMRETGKLGYPLEYFSIANIAKLRKRLPCFSRSNPQALMECRTSPNGVFSFKWNCNYGPMRLPFEIDYSIFIDRQNRKAQARSFVVAEKTGKWLESTKGRGSCSEDEMQRALFQLEGIRQRTFCMAMPDRIIYLEELQENADGIVTEIMVDIFGKEIKEKQDEDLDSGQAKDE